MSDEAAATGDTDPTETDVQSTTDRDATNDNEQMSENESTEDERKSSSCPTEEPSSSNGDSTSDHSPVCKKKTKQAVQREIRPCKKKQILESEAHTITDSSKEVSSPSDWSSNHDSSPQGNESACNPIICKKQEAVLESTKGKVAKQSRSDQTSNASSSEAATDTSINGDEDCDAKSARFEHSSQNLKSASSDQKGASAKDQPGWTLSEDVLLRGMKESRDNLSWVDIGKSLNRSKNDVKARWKVIKDQADNANATSEDEGQTTEASSYEKDGSSKAEAEPPSSKKEAIKSKTAQESSSKTKSPPLKKQPKDDFPEKPKDEPETQQKEDPEIMSGEEASSESSHKDENALQKQYLYKEIYGTLYSPEIHFEPDDVLSKDDCATLATIASKYEQGRLLEMQANFLNAAGRKIPISYLRGKIERGWKDEDRSRVERWVDCLKE